MALADTNELQNKLASLRRTPAPAIPATSGGKGNPLDGIKLKPTVPLKPHNSETHNNNIRKERSPSVKEKISFLQGGQPLPESKPKPRVPQRGSQSNDVGITNDRNKPRPPSVIDKPSPVIKSQSGQNIVPEAAPLPPAFTLGSPPAKPQKLKVWMLKDVLKKYSGTTHPPRPDYPSQTPENNDGNMGARKSNGVGNAATHPDEIYDDNIAQDLETSNTSDDIYDDNIENGNDDLYDDNIGEGDQTFGQDIYEPLEDIQDTNEHNGVTKSESLPPALPEKSSKDQVKEEKKKREKEMKEKKRKEKEEKEKEEREKKNQKKEKEKKITEMKKKFSVRGNERVLGICTAAVDVRGNKMELSATIGETFDIIRKDKPNPENKWLVRNNVGEYGFIDINNIEGNESEDVGQDFYEDVATYQQSGQNTMEDSNFATTKSPPPPPSRNPNSDDQDFYDDVASGDQDFYDDVAG